MIPLSTPTSVLLAGGGSAGHVSPLLSLADALRRRHPDVRLTALGTREGLEARLVPARGVDLRFVPKVPLPRRPSGDLLRLPGNLRAAVAAAGAAIDETVGAGRRRLRWLRQHARLPRGPAPGRADRRARAERSRRHRQPAGCALEHATSRRPSRAPRSPTPAASVCRCAARSPRSTASALRPEAAERFGLDPSRTTLLVTGGSLGAQRLNDAFRARRGPAR